MNRDNPNAGLRQGALLLLSLACVIAVSSAKVDDHPPPSAAPLSQRWMRNRPEVNLPDILSRRASLVVTYCGQCHAPPPASLHTGDEWRWMIVRMDMRAWSSQKESIRIPSNADLKAIAAYYDDFSPKEGR